MSLALYDTIRRIVQEELAAHRGAELAVVEEQHPHEDAGDQDNYACTVRLRDSDLVLQRVPIATQRIGSVSVPAVGDLVLVQFLGGDLNAPVITGRLHSSDARPPVSGPDQHVVHLPLGAGDADAVHLELRSGDTRELSIKLGSGLSLTLRDGDPAVTLQVGDAAASLSLKQGGDLTLTTQGALTLAADGKVVIKGSRIDLNPPDGPA